MPEFSANSAVNGAARWRRRLAYRLLVLLALAVQFGSFMWLTRSPSGANVGDVFLGEWLNQMSPLTVIALPFLMVIGIYGQFAAWIGLLMFWRPAPWILLVLPHAVFHLVERVTPPVTASRTTDEIPMLLVVGSLIHLLPVALAFLPPFRAEFRASTTRWWMVGLAMVAAGLALYLVGAGWRFLAQ